RYWAASGLFMPYLASTLASISGESLRSMSNGPPGAARIMKKASVTTTKSVGIATSRRRPMKRNMGRRAPLACGRREGRALRNFHRPPMMSTKAAYQPQASAMSDFRRVTEDLSVAPQISVADVAEAAAQGFTTIINNRPDGEDPAAPQSAEIEAAAKSHGLHYVHVPVRGAPGPA